MTIELVVARYLEDLAWLHNIPPQIAARVCDKSPSGDTPNVGREAHSYLHHIVENYGALADTTIFAQGKPSSCARALYEPRESAHLCHRIGKRDQL